MPGSIPAGSTSLVCLIDRLLTCDKKETINFNGVYSILEMPSVVDRNIEGSTPHRHPNFIIHHPKE